MSKRKTRKQKEEEYKEKYSHIPIGFKERLEWMYDHYNINEKIANQIIEKKNAMMNALQYYDLDIVLYEVPEGSPRPRFRVVNRSNLSNMALSNPNFIHVYSLTGHEDYVYMKRLIDSELILLDQFICTPCNIDICAYCKTPSYFSKQDIFLSELGLMRPTSKPDWDNIEKKYSDMFNKNVWLDDTFVVDGSIHKFYSILPRVEIKIRYLNMIYSKQQYNQVTNRKDFRGELNYFNMEDYKNELYDTNK